jgi:hypothetical protein
VDNNNITVWFKINRFECSKIFNPDWQAVDSTVAFFVVHTGLLGVIFYFSDLFTFRTIAYMRTFFNPFSYSIVFATISFSLVSWIF